MTKPHLKNWTGILVAVLAVITAADYSGPAAGAAPMLLRTPGYESPVRAGSDDLLFIAGSGFHSTDRVVYEAADASSDGRHPRFVPVQSTADRGTARIVKLGDPPYAITVQLPSQLQADRHYRLWVIDAAGEWSAPVSINDPRPVWVTPAYVYSSADFANLGRKVRVIGRNLEPAGTSSVWIRLDGPAKYSLSGAAASQADGGQPSRQYIAEAGLPNRLVPGEYSVAVSVDGRAWVPVAGQKLEVRQDPAAPATFDVSDPRFGTCKPDDDADDTACFARAFEAAREAGRGTVLIPAGRWDVSPLQLPEESRRNGFVLTPDIHLRGAGPGVSIVVRHQARSAPLPGALFTLVGRNSVVGVSFTDEESYESIQQSRPVLQLGIPRSPGAVEDLVISDNTFVRVGRGLVDSGKPLRHLFVTHNQFGAYDNALLLTGIDPEPAAPFRIDDSVVRWNRFVPGSYTDIPARTGTVAAQLGAAQRLDFSSNIADGTGTEGLQRSDDPPGWRAAFFWNLTNNVEDLLVADNMISCPGDRAGDGEALAFDMNGNAFGFDTAQPAAAAGPDWIRVRHALLHAQNGRPVPEGYYNGHWMTVVEGPGIGQTRRVLAYTEDAAAGTATFHVAPAWDIEPAGGSSRVLLGRQFREVYVVGNLVTQASPPCRKSNLNGPRGGVIGFWTPVADSTIEGNRQVDTDGIVFLQDYSARTPSCPACRGAASFATGLEIRGNVIDGEYDWSSDCSWSGIRAYFVATPTPEAPPPPLSFGVLIAQNLISRADGQRGGAIDIAHAGAAGPPPANWPMVQNLLIFRNVIRDMTGSPPRSPCHEKQGPRAGIRLEGPGNVRDTVLQGNRCERVDRLLEDAGVGTVSVCSSDPANSCDCGSP